MDLSVIIPVCDAQNRIAACLRSVTRCPRENIDMECIVVSGDSTDETAAIVNRYAERDCRIRLAVEEGRDASSVRNKGIEEAGGRYILFLDANDRLCEDAWEQIEAAVEEEYADFVAFSYITLRQNGKFQARMLPLPDVVSTDEGEARRLMYADSVLKTCRGKLFKNRIIRDHNILFQAGFPAGADFFFVTEYFEHCESCLMTKAMILYCPQKDTGILQNYAAADDGMKERLDLLWNLYDYSVRAVWHYYDGELLRCVQEYFFRVLSGLFCVCARECGHGRDALETACADVLSHKFVRTLLGAVDEGAFHSRISRYECRLLKKGDSAAVRRYFSIKAALYGSQESGTL